MENVPHYYYVLLLDSSVSDADSDDPGESKSFCILEIYEMFLWQSVVLVWQCSGRSVSHTSVTRTRRSATCSAVVWMMGLRRTIYDANSASMSV